MASLIKKKKGNRLYYYLVDRKSTRLNSSHSQISYAVFCLKKKIVFLPRRLIASATTFWSSVVCSSNTPDVQGTKQMAGRRSDATLNPSLASFERRVSSLP